MTLSALTASIAHEVSQPVAALTIEANVALRWLKRAKPNVDEAVESLNSIVQQGQRARDVIGGMRAMLRKTGPQAQRIDLNEMIAETLPLLAGELTRHRVMLKTELAPALPAVSADKVQLQQVFLNLAINAIEAMRDIEAHGRELTVRTAVSPTGEVLVTVHDVGSGLPDDPDQLFEAFIRPSPKAWAWACRSAARSWNPTAASCRHGRTAPRARCSASACRLPKRRPWQLNSRETG